jgi:hypothetical protein
MRVFAELFVCRLPDEMRTDRCRDEKKKQRHALVARLSIRSIYPQSAKGGQLDQPSCGRHGAYQNSIISPDFGL